MNLRTLKYIWLKKRISPNGTGITLHGVDSRGVMLTAYEISLTGRRKNIVVQALTGDFLLRYIRFSKDQILAWTARYLKCRNLAKALSFLCSHKLYFSLAG